MRNRWGKFRRFWRDMRLERKLLVSYILFAVIPILVIGSAICLVSVSYTHLTLPTILLV